MSARTGRTTSRLTRQSVVSFLSLSTIFVLSAVGTQACGTKASCKKLFERNKQCADAFEQYVLAKSGLKNPTASTPSTKNVMPPATSPAHSDASRAGATTGQSPAPKQSLAVLHKRRAERKAQQRQKTFTAAAKQLKTAYTSKNFLTSCTRAWLGNEAEDRRIKKATARCLVMKSCDAYVRCMVAIRVTRHR